MLTWQEKTLCLILNSTKKKGNNQTLIKLALQWEMATLDRCPIFLKCFMCMGDWSCVCMYTVCMPGIRFRDQKRTSDCLELELQTVVSSQVGAEN